MFEPHSLLWHYLWVAPCVVLLFLAVILYRRSLQREFPIFFLFVVFQGVTGLVLYVLDLKLPRSLAGVYWQANLVHLLIEVVLKFALLGEIFSQLLKPYPALSKLGKLMIRAVGPVLVLGASLAIASFPTSEFPPIVAASLRVTFADFAIECGLLLFMFVVAAYFHLPWGRLAFGIAVGRGVAASVQLGAWALWSNLAITRHQRNLLDFLNMGVYHLSVLIWIYCALTTPKVTLMDKLGEDDDHDDDHDAGGHDGNGEDERQQDLVVWNRELERLLQR
jgi:hypothetical protein